MPKRLDISAVRRAASAKGLASRWGERRGKSKQVRVSEEAFAALATVPERYRRAIASMGVMDAVEKWRR